MLSEAPIVVNKWHLRQPQVRTYQQPPVCGSANMVRAGGTAVLCFKATNHQPAALSVLFSSRTCFYTFLLIFEDLCV